MDVTGTTSQPFRVTACVPDDMISLGADGDWAVWSGVDCAADGGRSRIVLVSISVSAFDPAPGASAREVLRATLRAGHPAGAGVVDEFTVAHGNPAARVRCEVTHQLNGRPVTTGQAQALVMFPGASALGVVSGVSLDPADLDRALALVTGIAARLTVTAAPAAA